VFVDFGRGKVYALTDKGEQVEVFDNLEDVIGKLCPNTVVIDSLPAKFQKTAADLGKIGVTFLRLRRLERLSEERKSNGVEKTDENDVRLLRRIFRHNPDTFRPLFTSPEELVVRALTEMWVTIAAMKKVSKYTRTTTNNPVAVKINKALQNNICILAKEIDVRAMSLPLYKKAVEELGLKGPIMA